MRYLIVCLAAFFSSIHISLQDEECSAVLYEDRKDCWALTEYDCEQQGCCWDDGINRMREKRESEPISIFGSGYTVINSDDEDDDDDEEIVISSSPRCFLHPKSYMGACEIHLAEDKEDCGHPGMHPQECMKKDCCYRPTSIPGDPPCFRKRKEYQLIQDGAWGPWSAWTRCFGKGVQTRGRLCNNPQPLNDGKYCEGDAFESRQCIEEEAGNFGQCTNVPAKQRQDCSWGWADSAYSCEHRGCCWNPCIPQQEGDCDGVPSCYLSTDMFKPECLVSGDQLVDCGDPSTTLESCLRRGCCYRPSNYEGYWCFKKNPDYEGSGNEGSGNFGLF